MNNPGTLRWLSYILLISSVSSFTATGLSPHLLVRHVTGMKTSCSTIKEIMATATTSPTSSSRSRRRQSYFLTTRQRYWTTLTATSDDASMNVANQSNEGIKPPFSVTLEEDDYDYQQAIQRTAGWVGAAITFGAVLWAVAGSNVGEEFFAGYLVEQSLSVDNLFVFLVLFEYFKVPLNLQDRVLNWGIYGAIVMRAFMIGLGAAALQQFHAILLVFAAILIYGSVSFFLGAGKDEDEDDLSQNTIVKFSSSLINSTDRFDGKKFFTMEDGVRKATPLFICMIAVEISDIVFAVDSIPAVFGVTDNPLVVFSSNLFAIMGLRSLYTILSKAATDLQYLEPAVAIVLGFIGTKMILEFFGFHVPTSLALAVVTSVLSIGVGSSIWAKENKKQQQPVSPDDLKK